MQTEDFVFQYLKKEKDAAVGLAWELPGARKVNDDIAKKAEQQNNEEPDNRMTRPNAKHTRVSVAGSAKNAWG